MKKVFEQFAIWLYIFALIGFVLHTSNNNEQVFGKYSFKYFFLLVMAFGLFPFYVRLIKYTSYKSKYQLKRWKLQLSPFRKTIILLLSVLLFASIVEVFYRFNHVYERKTVEDMEFHPFLQSKLKKNNGSDAHINSYGFRSDEISKIKPDGTYRIIVLGGSTAYGVGISYEKSWGKLLQDMLRKHFNHRIEVINAGVSGYNSEHSLIDYMSRISEFKPDLIIMWSGVNDVYASCANTYSLSGPYQSDYSHLLGPVERMVSSYFYPPIIDLHLFVLDAATNFIYQYLYSDLHGFYSSLMGKITESKYEIPIGDMQYPSAQSYRRNLEYLIALVRWDKAKIVLGNQPNMFGTISKFRRGGLPCFNGRIRASLESQAKAMVDFNKITEEVAEENDVPFIDLDSYLPRNPDYFFDEIHWTEKGHQLATQKLYDFIIAGNFIPD